MSAKPYYAVSVGTSAVSLTQPGYYGTVGVYNNGTSPIYIGADAAVTTATGFPVAGGGSIAFASNATQPSLYAISTATQDVRVYLGSV